MKALPFFSLLLLFWGGGGGGGVGVGVGGVPNGRGDSPRL